MILMGKQALFYYPYEFSSASSTFQELGTCYVFLMKLDYIQLPTTYVVTMVTIADYYPANVIFGKSRRF